ncbi:DUF3726 domain-containing protein [Pseudopelagicola sp. nBUS_19]|uniref:DUF3726 domain-containing protein n=1 Tax=Pseudopelagicola sp. nBUS_19 TaxID=3395316 RepID=UPI003EBB64A6
MNFSLNEVEATAKRAARGAGYSWGIAEEAAKATRWLCHLGLDGSQALAKLLTRDFASNLKIHAPLAVGGKWCAEHDLCPLLTGAHLSDFASKLSGNTVELQNVACPTLLLPFAASAARTLNLCLTIECDGIETVTNGADVQVSRDIPARATKMLVYEVGRLTLPRARHSRFFPNLEDWEILNQFAHRTFAPATDESRLLGAGSGLSDND